MKYFSRIFAPTSNRRLNELIGFLLCVSALLLFLALVSYSPLDPSLNSASVLTGSRVARNWIGVVGAIWLVIFVPALLALLPGRVRWMGSVPMEGLVGRVVGDVLIHYFNLAGA